MSSKSEIRKIYLEKRRELSAQQISLRSSEIAERFFSQIDLSAVKALHTFLRIAKLNEIDTSTIYFRIWRDHPWVRTFAPRLKDGTGEMESVEFDDAAELVENAWGISEPAGTETAGPNVIDLVIVPLLCFDEAGHRVGYGKGYYDRFLARCRPDCLKVGLSLFPPLKLIANVFETDVPLDICLTRDETYDFRSVNEFAN